MEHSYKFDVEGLNQMGSQSGFGLDRTWLDSKGLFSSNLFRALSVES